MTCFRDNDGWWVKGRHLPHPEDWTGDCPSCQPCTERHCPHCRKGEHLAFGEHTCPTCIGRVRAQLRTMVDLYAALPDEAVVKGVTSEAANLWGPHADPEAFSHRRVSIMAGRISAPLEDEDEYHPRLVLHRYVWMLSEDYSDPYDGSDDIASLVDWIDRRLHRIANDAGQDFGLFRREVGKVVGHLEAVLHDGEQRDTGAPCLECRTPLVREWGKLAAADGWRCPKCRTFRTETDYRLNVADLHSEHATYLTDRDMETRTNVKAGTVRSWARKDLVKRKRDSGRTVYSVADVLTEARRAGLVA